MIERQNDHLLDLLCQKIANDLGEAIVLGDIADIRNDHRDTRTQTMSPYDAQKSTLRALIDVIRLVDPERADDITKLAWQIRHDRFVEIQAAQDGEGA